MKSNYKMSEKDEKIMMRYFHHLFSGVSTKKIDEADAREDLAHALMLVHHDGAESAIAYFKAVLKGHG